MSDVRLYVDEDACEHAVVHGLRARGIDVITTQDAGRTGDSDEEQLAFAAEQSRTIYTFNVRDFARLHHAWLSRRSQHVGIVVIPDQRCSIGEKIRRLARFVRSFMAEEMVDRIEFL